MLRLLADENFNSDIVRGLLFQDPSLDVVRVPDVGLAGEDDRAMLAWAAEHDPNGRGALSICHFELPLAGSILCAPVPSGLLGSRPRPRVQQQCPIVAVFWRAHVNRAL